MAFFTKAIVCLLVVAATSAGHSGNYGRRPSGYGGLRRGSGSGVGVGGYSGVVRTRVPGVGIGGVHGFGGVHGAGAVPGVGVHGSGVGVHGSGVVPGVGVHGSGVVPGVGVHGSGVVPGFEIGGKPGAGIGGVPGVGGSNLVQVLPINKLNGGSYDPYSIWPADCNRGNYGYQRFMTGIWDDLNNFKDLDKVKCTGSAYGVTLNLKDSIVLDLQHGKHGLSQCPENYVMTALFDVAFGFPHPSKAKCTRVTYGYLDNYDILTLYTDHKSGGPYDNYQPWNVECPPESAMVGIKKEYGRAVAINCAPLKRHHKHY